MTRTPQPANNAWMHALLNVMGSPETSAPRGMLVREMLAQKSIIDMNEPVVTIPERELNYKFMIEEALWILEGRNDVFHKNIAPYSDNGRVMQGAYGPKVTEQVQFVVEKLREDPDSRQAVISTWRECPRNSKDVPCTMSLQFLWRTLGMNMVVTMRSSDLWLGFPYDVFSFTMIAHYVRLSLKPMSPSRLFGLYLTAGSSHIYEKDMEKAIICTRTKETGSKFGMNLYDLDTPDDLLEYLRVLRDDKGVRDKALGLT